MKRQFILFQHSGAVKSGKKKSWKSLKQIAQSERSQAPADAPICTWKQNFDSETLASN